MAPRNEPGDGPWYRTPAATFTAGGIGAVLLGALTVTVVQMSDQWSTPPTTVVTTPAATSVAPTTARDRQPFVITPSDSTTSFTTSVPLSTTDIGIPTGVPGDTITPTSETSGTSTTSETTTTATTTAAATETEDQDEEPTTTRKRPRYNETRTYSPGR